MSDRQHLRDLTPGPAPVESSRETESTNARSAEPTLTEAVVGCPDADAIILSS